MIRISLKNCNVKHRVELTKKKKKLLLSAFLKGIHNIKMIIIFSRTSMQEWILVTKIYTNTQVSVVDFKSSNDNYNYENV